MFAESLLFQLAVVERQTLGEIFAKVISPSLIRVDSSCDLSVSYPVSLQGMRFFFLVADSSRFIFQSFCGNFVCKQSEETELVMHVDGHSLARYFIEIFVFSRSSSSI